MTINIENGVLRTNSFLKPTDTHQCSESSLCYPYHCKKGNSYRQALLINRICSDKFYFDTKCND